MQPADPAPIADVVVWRRRAPGCAIIAAFVVGIGEAGDLALPNQAGWKFSATPLMQ